MEIVRLYDDCGHELGYFDLSTKNGNDAIFDVLITVLSDYEEDFEKNLIKGYREIFPNAYFDYKLLSDFLEDSIVYVEKIEIVR